MNGIAEIKHIEEIDSPSIEVFNVRVKENKLDREIE